ncbi:MAG: PAS domain S-box protein [Melioribacteraceae bacterium]|nr:PAS domain S-box protein [Melioribacteraceae bacterium]
MELEYQFFLIQKGIAFLFSIYVCILFLRKRNVNGAFAFFLLGLFNIFWIIGNAIEVLSQDFETKVFGLTLSYLAIPILPALWSIGVLRFITLGIKPSRRFVVLIMVVPIITVFLMATNIFHHLMYINFSLIEYGQFLLIKPQQGAWFWVHVFYSYSMIAVTSVYVLWVQRGSDNFLTKQKIYLVISSFAPALFSLMHVLNITSINYTSSSFVIAVIVLGIAIYKHGLLEIIPAARDRIIESMEDCVLVLDKMDRIIDQNPAAINLLKSGNAYGKKLRDAFPQIRALKRLTGDHNLINNEIEIKGKTFEIISSPITDKKGKEIGSVYTFRDITTRKKSEEAIKKSQLELIELNRIKDKFFSIISHDLKNPFQSLLGYAQMLKEEFDTYTVEEKKEIIEGILNISKKTQQLLDNLLNWARLQTNRIKIYEEEINLERLVDQIFDTLYVQASLKKVKLICDVSHHIKLKTDFDILSVVLRNLISNAIKFSYLSGTVRVLAVEKNDRVEISVIDAGVGMSPEIVEGLFDLKNLISERGTKGEKGTGLGLILCKEFIEKIEGTIWVSSIEGEGSIFTFSLPHKLSQ